MSTNSRRHIPLLDCQSYNINQLLYLRAEEGIVVLGEVIPFYIGAAVSPGINYMFSTATIKSTNMTFTKLLKGKKRRRGRGATAN